MADVGKMALIDAPQQVVQAIGLPDEHYNMIRKMLKKRKEAPLKDKDGNEAVFYFDGEQMKARTVNGTQDVFSLSQVRQDTRSEIGMRESLATLAREKNPGIEGEALEAAVDILQEGINTAKRLVSLGVPFDKARQIVGTALAQQSDFSKEDLVRLVGEQ